MSKRLWGFFSLPPPNVKVTEEGMIKILDFGLAKAMADDDAIRLR